MSSLRVQLDLLKTHLDEHGIMDENESQALIDTIENANLSPADKEKLIKDISDVAEIPVVTNTKDRVARWRKIIISLILAGITGFSLEKIIPGIYYTLYERIYTTVMSLVAAGISSVQIREFINNPPSIPIPDIRIPEQNIPGLMASLTEALKTGFFTAASIAVGCIGMVCRGGGQVLNQLTIENFNYTAKLAAQLAVPRGVSYAYKVLRGDLDQNIADLIDGGVILNIADNTVSGVKDTITDAVRESAEDVGNAMLDITWSDVAPNSRLDADTNSIINNAIREQIEQMKANPQSTASITELLNDILIVLRADDKVAAIEVFKNKYKDINRTIPKLLELLTAKQAQLKPNFDNFSQPEPSSAAMSVGSPLTRATSLLGNYKLPVKSDDPNAVRNEYVAFPSLNSFDAVKNRERLKQVGIIPSGKKEAKITWNKDKDRFLYEFINVWLNDKDHALVQKLNLLSAEDHNAIINRIKEMATERGGYNLLPSLDNTNLDRSQEELYELFNTIYKTIKVQMDTYAGGSRRKSRQYKKKRSTLKRRRVKGRRTRKGKKRISTKRRR